MSDLINRIRQAQVLATEEAVINSLQDSGLIDKEQTEYELHTQGARHSFEPPYDGNDPDRNKPYQQEAIPQPADPMKEPSDEELREMWRKAGGRFHGPNVETGTMPEAKLLPFLRGLLRAAQPGVPDTIYLGCARMGMAGASDEEVLRYARMATTQAEAKPQQDLDPTPEEEEAWQQMERECMGDPESQTGIYNPEVQILSRANRLVEEATKAGMVVRIDLQPKQPLAMGNLEMVVEVRPARSKS